jgi:hypothetical protein
VVASDPAQGHLTLKQTLVLQNDVVVDSKEVPIYMTYRVTGSKLAKSHSSDAFPSKPDGMELSRVE